MCRKEYEVSSFLCHHVLVYCSAATAGDGHSAQVAAVHAVLGCCYHCPGAGASFKDGCCYPGDDPAEFCYSAGLWCQPLVFHEWTVCSDVCFRSLCCDVDAVSEFCLKQMFSGKRCWALRGWKINEGLFLYGWVWSLILKCPVSHYTDIQLYCRLILFNISVICRIVSWLWKNIITVSQSEVYIMLLVSNHQSKPPKLFT